MLLHISKCHIVGILMLRFNLMAIKFHNHRPTHGNTRKRHRAQLFILPHEQKVNTPDRGQSKVLLTNDECGSKSLETVFDCHLGRRTGDKLQSKTVCMTLSTFIESTFVDNITVLDCCLSGVVKQQAPSSSARWLSDLKEHLETTTKIQHTMG